jgi:putative peptidoglycan lipid II flippase
VGVDEGEQRDRAREKRSAAVVAGAILLSRLVGLLRQRVTAHYFGTSAVADVVAAAFRVGNLAQNLLGEGTLSASFIPVYARLRAAGRDGDAVAFARAALGLLGLAVLALSIVGILAAPWLAYLVAAGFDAEKLGMTARLVRIVFPMTGLLVLCAWALGVLNAHRRFFVPYAAPVVWSLAQIAALVVAGGWFAWRGEPLATALSYGALAGAGINFVVLLAAARPLLGAVAPTFDGKNEAVREAARKLPGAILGRGMLLISGLVDTQIVSFLGTGANAVFGYAQTLFLLPMSLLGTGEAAVSLPEMARETADADEARRSQRMRARLGSTITRVAVMTVPVMALLCLFGVELVRLLLETGQFDTESTHRVAALLVFYGLALPANASQRLFATTYFALGDTSRPARFAVVRVVVSTALALLLMGPLGVSGVVIGAATAGWLEAVLLATQLRGRIGGLGLEEVPVLRLVALAAVTAGVPFAVRAALPAHFASGRLGAVVVLGALGLAFALAAPLLGLFQPRSWLGR